jgi:hypothetical protein
MCCILAPPPPPPHVVVMAECNTIIIEFADVPALKDAMQRRDELQREFTALNAAKTNFKEIARVGAAHKAAVATVSRLSRCEKDYAMLADRHAALVLKVTTMCVELADAGDFDALSTLATKLEELKALDVLWVNDPVQPPAPPASTAEEGEDDDANDPVYVPPAPGTSKGSVATVSHALKAICVTAEEGEDDGANDPVYVPADTDEITLA